MAKKRKSAESTAASAKVDESTLTKGEIRKLNALRKSVGHDLAESTFVKWLYQRPGAADDTIADKNAELIAATLMTLIADKKLRIPRGGYLVTRGRGRVIVEQPVYS